jgi:hypothetical protein
MKHLPTAPAPVAALLLPGRLRRRAFRDLLDLGPGPVALALFLRRFLRQPLGLDFLRHLGSLARRRHRLFGRSAAPAG